MSSESEMQFLSASSLFQVRSVLVVVFTEPRKYSSGRELRRSPSSAPCPAYAQMALEICLMLLKLFSKRESATTLAHCRVSPLLSDNIRISSIVPLGCSQSTAEDSQWQFSLQCLVLIRLLLFITYPFDSDIFFF